MELILIFDRHIMGNMWNKTTMCVDQSVRNHFMITTTMYIQPPVNPHTALEAEEIIAVSN